jgi:hypothetical protein
MEIKKHQLEPVTREVETHDMQNDIYLSIRIGNGQIGGNKVSSIESLLAKGNLTEPTFIGSISNLKNTEVEIETNVLDVNPFTNICVITTTFLNQENKILFTKIDKGEAPENGIASFNGKYIIKFIVLLFILLSSFNNNLNAQTTSNNLEFKNLETPASPGFILLDQTPSAIEKPTTPQGLGLSLLGFQQNGGAIEFAPFWLTTHPKLTAEKMLKNHTPILSHFSISLASVKTDSASYYTAGIRTRLFQTYETKIIEKLISIKTNIENELSKSPNEIEKEKVDKLRQEYVNITQKPSLNIDLAAALAGGSITNSFDDIEFSRWAVWLSINWRPSGDDFYMTLLSRYINNEKYNSYQTKSDLVDVGIRINHDYSKFSFSVEYLHRMNITSEAYDDFRIAMVGSYRLSENIYVTSTFGKNYSEINNIIALAGINFGFSKNKIEAK